MKKRIFSLMLALTLVIALAACGSAPAESAAAPAGDTPAADTPAAEPAAEGETAAAEPAATDLEPYNIVYYMYSTKPSDQAPVVAEALNAIIGPKFNATVEFVMVTGNDWNEKAIVPLRAGEKIDIFWTPEWMQYMSNIQNGSLLALDDPNGPYGDLINTYAPQTVADLGDFIPANVVNGSLYGVAVNKELCVPGGLMWNKTLVDKYNIDVNSITTPEALDEVLVAFKDSEDYAAGIYPLLMTTGYSAFDPFIQGFMGDMEPINIRIGEPGATDGEPELFWNAQETRDRVALAKKWYDDGLLHPDSYLTSFTNMDYLNAGNFLVSTDFVLKGGQVKAQELMGSSGNSELSLVEVQTSASVNVTTHAGGAMLGIPITSEDPARAMMFINEMHQNEELLNTMAWGIEGVHYDKNEEGLVVPKEMNGWSDSHGGMWTLGNQFKQWLSAGEAPDKYEQMQALTAEAWAHESLGFRFDRTGFDNEYAAVYNIMQTYSRPFKCGVNTEQYDQMLAELDAAGIQNVLAAAKEQYAAWKAAK